MKIYFADTVQREALRYNEKLPIRHRLESYFKLRYNVDISKWSIFKERKESIKDEIE